MDFEARMVLYVVALGAGVRMVALFRARARIKAPAHLGALAVLVAVSLAGLWDATWGARVAWPAFWLFCAVVLGPSLLLQLARRMSRARRFGLAAFLARVSSALLGLPPGLRHEGAMYGALARAGRGDVAGAEADLERVWKAGALPAAQGGEALVRALPLAAAHRWAAVLDAIAATPSDAPVVRVLHIRALAETGALSAAIAVLEELERTAVPPPLRDGARRVVLAAAGRVDFLREAVGAKLPIVSGPRGTADVTVARALEAVGDLDEARRSLRRASRLRSAVGAEAREALARLDDGQPRVTRAQDLSTSLAAIEERCRADAASARAGGLLGTRGIVALTLATFVISAPALVFVGTGALELLAAGALSAPLIVEEGEWWRLLSTMLLHGSWLHLIVNLATLPLIGIHVERRIGAAATLTIYVLSGIGGSLGSALLNHTPVGVGASGGAMGLVGALLVLCVLRPHRFAPGEARRWRDMVVIGTLATFAIGLAEAESIDNWAHGIGALTGIVLTLPFLDGARRMSRAAQVGLRATATVLVAALALSGVLAAAQWSSWTTPQVARAGEASVTLPGWLRLRPAAGDTVLAARRPAEVRVLLGDASGVEPDPLAVLPENDAFGEAWRAEHGDALPDEDGLSVPPAADGAFGPDFTSGYRVRLYRSGDAYVLVLSAADPETDRAYSGLLRGNRGSLRSDSDADSEPDSAGDVGEER